MVLKSRRNDWTKSCDDVVADMMKQSSEMPIFRSTSLHGKPSRRARNCRVFLAHFSVQSQVLVTLWPLKIDGYLTTPPPECHSPKRNMTYSRIIVVQNPLGQSLKSSLHNLSPLYREKSSWGFPQFFAWPIFHLAISCFTFNTVDGWNPEPVDK